MIEPPPPGLLQRSIQALGPKPLLTWGLLLATLVSIITGLTDVVRDVNFGYLFLIMTTAVTLGWLAALLPLKGWITGTIGTLLGISVVLTRVGRLERTYLQIYGRTFSLITQVVAWLWAWISALVSRVFTHEPITVTRSVDWTALIQVHSKLWHNIGTLFSRLWVWLRALMSGTSAYDPIAIALAWGFIMWTFALWAGWWTRRHHNPLLAILPAGLLISFILDYAWAPSAVLLPMAGFTLLLMAVDRQRARELNWNLSGVDFSRDLWSDVVMSATVVSILLVLVAAVSPLASVEHFEAFVDWVEKITQRDEAESEPYVADSLGIEQQPQPARPVSALERAAVTTLPRRHLIGSGPELSRIVVMVIRTGELPELPALLPEEDLNVPRHYWRSITYDHYYSQGWSTSRTAVAKYEPGEMTMDTDAPYHKLLRQEVQMVGSPDDTVYVDGLLLSTDQKFEVHWRSPSGIFAATVEESPYFADSLVAEVTVEDLRAARSEVPDWIRERYLQLPEELPSRVRELALELTVTQPTAYDRAKAIEHYLRQFTYTLQIPAPPLGKDIADYFLFDLQEGYCDYYATTMVVMARAAGVPARLVIGYASGSYDIENARYVVTEADAHAWPEIYFPGIGWVEFEPTGGYPEIDRSATHSPSSTTWEGEDRPPPLVESKPSALFYIVLGRWLLILGGGTLAIALGFSVLDSLFLLMWGAPGTTVTRLYHRLCRYQQTLRARICKGQTPYEMADALISRLKEIGADRPLVEEILPGAESEVRDLVELYIRVWYTSHPLSSKERQFAVARWWILHWRLWLARLVRSPRRERPPMPTLKKAEIGT